MPTALRRFPAATLNGPRTATGNVVMRTPAVLTAAYVEGDDGATDAGVCTLGFERIVLEVTVTLKGDATSVQIQGEHSADGGATWATFGVVQSPSAAGVSEGTFSTLQMTLANYATGNVVEFDIDVKGKSQVRFKAKETGGAGPTTQIGIKAAGGLTPVAAD